MAVILLSPLMPRPAWALQTDGGRPPQVSVLLPLLLESLLYMVLMVQWPPADQRFVDTKMLSGTRAVLPSCWGNWLLSSLDEVLHWQVLMAQQCLSGCSWVPDPEDTLKRFCLPITRSHVDQEPCCLMSTAWGLTAAFISSWNRSFPSLVLKGDMRVLSPSLCHCSHQDCVL